MITGPIGRLGTEQIRIEAYQKRESVATRASIDSKPIHEVLFSPCQPFEAATRVFMELYFGHDFSVMRMYTDARAAELARAAGCIVDLRQLFRLPSQLLDTGTRGIH